MTKRETERRTFQDRNLRRFGFTSEECEQLRRISMTLHRWYERECGIDGGCVERTPEGKAVWRSAMTGRTFPTRDMEKGALRRLAKIFDSTGKPQRISATYYLQTDPRGVALYVIDAARLSAAQAEWAITRPTTPIDQVIDSVYSQIGFPVY